jgi:CHAD domain-containing protein
VGGALIAAGAEPGRFPSKLTRVLADRLGASPPSPPRPSTPADTSEQGKEGTSGTQAEEGGQNEGKRRKEGKRARRRRQAAATQSAGDLLRSTLATQFLALQDADLMVRTATPDGIHQVRVACRRLRSVLTAFRPVLDPEVTEFVRGELRWIGGQLGSSRDAEVAAAHLRELVAAQPPELVLGPVAARVQRENLPDGAVTDRPVPRVLAGSRYLHALDALADLVADPPLTDRGGEAAGPIAAEVLAATSRCLRRRVRLARDTDDPAALHDVRKAAKRLRYTAEVIAPVLGPPVDRLLIALQDVQRILGDRQDTVATRQLCTRLGLQAFAAGENAWTYGRLHGLEQARCAQAEREFWAHWPVLRRAMTA